MPGTRTRSGGNLMDIQTARAQYLQNGYDAIPLFPNSKKPVSPAWQKKATITQWHYAKPNGNIGLRAGNGRAFIDADDKTTPGVSVTVSRWLAGLGYQEGDYPVVRTPNNGTHIYVNFTDSARMIDSKKNLLPDMGAGHFAFGPGAYVGAWPSVTDEGAYTLIRGDIARLPALDLHDISQLIDINSQQEQRREDKRMSRLALAIANGTKPDKYKSNSEGEAGLVLSLINKEYTYEEVKHVFDSYPCLGHYSGKHAAKGSREGERWLYMTYKSALAYYQHESPARRMIAELLQRARSAAWQNANRKKIYIAHLETAYKPGRIEYAAAGRDLAISAGVSRDTAMYQTAKLIDKGLINVVTPGSVVSATVYRLGDGELPAIPEGTTAEPQAGKLSGHDAFRNGGGKYAKGRLGRRAGEIYELIYNNPLTVKEIVRRTGAVKKTVDSALEKMKKFVDYRTGEVIEIVTYSSGDNTWIGNLVNLDLVAGFTKTLGATGKQRIDYEKERRDHTRNLELGTIKQAEHDRAVI